MSRLGVVGCVALWWGSLTTIGFLVVPMLFAYLPTPAMAGSMAAKLFTAQTWLSCVCGLFLLLNIKSTQLQTDRAGVQAAAVFILAGMLLALLVEFAVAPRILARENLRFWHSVGSVMYVLQWVCAAATFSKVMSPPPQA